MASTSFHQYIRYIELDRERVPSFSKYPFNLPAVKGLDTLTFHPQVTFIVGENGSGKSTILESIAVAYANTLPITFPDVLALILALQKYLMITMQKK